MKIRASIKGFLVIGEVNEPLYIENKDGKWITVIEEDGQFEVGVLEQEQGLSPLVSIVPI